MEVALYMSYLMFIMLVNTQLSDMKEKFSTNIYIKNDAISAMEKNKNKNFTCVSTLAT